MRTIATIALLAAATTAVHAEESYDNTRSAGSPNLTIGASMLFMPKYSGADSYDSVPLPLISAKKEITPGNTAYIRGLQAGIDHAFTDQLSAGIVGNYRFGRDSSDSATLSGMQDIDSAIELGPKVRYQVNRQLGIEGRVLFDVSDASEGYTARLGADYTVPLSQVTYLTIDGGLNYGSEDFNNTYYGVTNAQARAGRPAYAPDSGLTSVDAGATLRHAFTSHWSVQGRLGAEYLASDVADSPIVERSLQPYGVLGIAYSF